MPEDVLDGTSGYLEEFVKRMCAAELEYLEDFKTALGAVDSVPYFYHVQSAFPYITHRLGEVAPDEVGSELQNRSYTVIGRFVVGHLDKGYKGQSELEVYRWLPLIENLYTRNIYLLSANYPLPQREGGPEQDTFVRDTGTRFFDNRGIEGLSSQVGFEFSIRGTFSIDIERMYYYGV